MQDVSGRAVVLHIQDFVGKAEGKSPLGRPSVRWEDIVKIGLQERDGAWTGLI